MGDDGGGHWLVRMEWRPAGWSVCLPLLIFPCTMKSRSSLLALTHPGDPGKGRKTVVVVVWWRWSVIWCALPGSCVTVTQNHLHHFTTLFWATQVSRCQKEIFFWTFMVQGRITEADTPTIQMGPLHPDYAATHIQHPPHFYAGVPSCRNPPNLSCPGTGTSQWLDGGTKLNENYYDLLRIK